MPQQTPLDAEHICPNIHYPAKGHQLQVNPSFSGYWLGPSQAQSSGAVRKHAVPNKWWHGNFLHHVSCQGGQQIPLTT